jgi:hypothetical protein
MEVPVVKEAKKKRKNGNDRWDILNGRELLQGKWCVVGRGGKLAGGSLDHVGIHYTAYFGKYVENCM